MEAAQEWLVALVFGAFMISAYSWTRFDEPVGESESQYFGIYKPRFHTSDRRYSYGRLGYVIAIVLLYLVLSFVPQLYVELVPGGVETELSKSPIIPLMIATSLTSLQNVPILKGLERRIRGFLHTFARIPSSVLRLVYQLQGAGFDFARFKDKIFRTPKLRISFSDELLEQLFGEDWIKSDGVLRPWFRVGCILDAMSYGTNGLQVDFDGQFVNRYKDELESISARHSAMAVEVKEYAEKVIKDPQLIDRDLEGRVTELRDRTYAYLVCAIHSNDRLETSAKQVLKTEFGFILTEHEAKPYPLKEMVHGSILVVFIAAAISTIAIVAFSNWRLPMLEVKPEQLMLPPSTIETIFLSIKTAVLYFSTILAALWVRSTLIFRRQWNNFRDLSGARPLSRYPSPILFGTAVGFCVHVLLFYLFELPDLAKTFEGDLKDVIPKIGGRLLLAMQFALHWVFLPLMVSAISVFLSGSRLRSMSTVWLTARALMGSAAIGVVGGMIMMWVSAEGVNRQELSLLKAELEICAYSSETCDRLYSKLTPPNSVPGVLLSNLEMMFQECRPNSEHCDAAFKQSLPVLDTIEQYLAECGPELETCDKLMQDINDRVKKFGTAQREWASLIGLFICIFKFLLFMVAQLVERKNQKDRNLYLEFKGAPVYGHSSEGRSFAMIFTENEHVLLFHPLHQRLNLEDLPEAKMEGLCVQMPEVSYSPIVGQISS